MTDTLHADWYPTANLRWARAEGTALAGSILQQEWRRDEVGPDDRPIRADSQWRPVPRVTVDAEELNRTEGT